MQINSLVTPPSSLHRKHPNGVAKLLKYVFSQDIIIQFQFFAKEAWKTLSLCNYLVCEGFTLVRTSSVSQWKGHEVCACTVELYLPPSFRLSPSNRRQMIKLGRTRTKGSFSQPTHSLLLACTQCTTIQRVYSHSHFPYAHHHVARAARASLDVCFFLQRHNRSPLTTWL